MANSVKVEVRRTMMTRRGRKFPPRKPMTFDLELPGQQATWEGFQTLQEHLKATFPRLQEEFTILYKDDKGELISCNNKEELQKVLNQAHESTILLYVQGPCNWKNKAKEVPVQCAHCSTSFEGTKTKCLECADFILCPQCDENGIHGNHVMVKCDRPRFLNHATQKYVEAIPKLCKDVREKTLGENMPRLCTKDIRQFWHQERKLRDDKMECDETVTAKKRKVADRRSPGTKKLVFEKQHRDVQCYSCTGVIQGMRVKCLECEDINLCQQCDEQGVHGNHVMVKCERQRFFTFALPKFAEVIPKLCGEMKGKEHGDSLPRLEANEIRQFWQKERKQKGNRMAQKRNAPEGQKPAKGVEKIDKGQYGVTCTNCKSPLQMMRIKCLECDDFDLCEACDVQGVHAGHVMVKCDKPKFFSHGLRHFAEVLPKLIEEHKKKHNVQLPRLERQDVRKFWAKNKAKGSENQKRQCKERRHHLKTTWPMFLQDISAHDETSGTDLEMATEECSSADNSGHTSSEDEMITKKVYAMDLGEKAEEFIPNAEVGHKIQQMRRQWMQKCLQEWRQQMLSRKESKQQNPNQEFNLWRPFMRGCWDSWVDMRAGSGIDKEEVTPKKGKHEKLSQSRHRWIQRCWKMWCNKASKTEKKSSPTDHLCLDEADKQGNEGGLLFIALMRECWKLMPQHLRRETTNTKLMPQHLRRETTNTDHTRDSGSVAEGSDDIDFDPERAQQMLKNCWVNGCRELWWMQIRKLMELPEVGNEEAETPSQIEVMATMSTKKNWRSYMQQIWRLWNQLCKQAGLAPMQKLISSEKGDLAMVRGQAGETSGSSVSRRPKQVWIDSCWPQWNEDMTKITTDESTESRTEKTRWNKRPFAGWRPLIIRTWQIMKSDEKCDTEETRVAQIRSMRAAWMKEVQREMKTMSVQQEGQYLDELHPREEVPAIKNISYLGKDAIENLQWENHSNIQRKLMQQYWQMLKTNKISKESTTRRCVVTRRHRRAHRKHHRVCHSATNDDMDEGTRPRLRLKLMKNSKSSSG